MTDAAAKDYVRDLTHEALGASGFWTGTGVTYRAAWGSLEEMVETWDSLRDALVEIGWEHAWIPSPLPAQARRMKVPLRDLSAAAVASERFLVVHPVLPTQRLSVYPAPGGGLVQMENVWGTPCDMVRRRST